MADQWIVIPNWAKFQSRRERPNAPWIKVYRDLLHKDEWLDLPLAPRGLLTSVWLAYAEWNGRLRVSDLQNNLGRLRDTHGTLERLNQAGFLRFVVDRPLYLYKPVDARARVDEGNVRAAEAFIRNGAASHIPLAHLAEVIAEDYHVTDQTLVDRLMAEAQSCR